MIGTYAAVVAVGGASLAIGQAALSLCGVRRWSWLAPAVGLPLLLAVCWATVRLPGDGAVSAILVVVLTLAAVVYLRGRLEGGGEALRAGAPAALVALLAASLPFAVEGHFGILGTGFNPDMSQHLLATDRLAGGVDGQLVNQGYPLGPHAAVVALEKGLGIDIVHGFDGLTIAIVILAPLTALAAFADRPRVQRTAAALLVGLPYLVASYYAQGSFKETTQALLVLAFVLALRESTRPAWRDLPLRFVPAAIIAIGTVYTYSFPGLVWLVPIAAIWAIADYIWTKDTNSSPAGGGGEGVSVPARRPVFRPTDSASSTTSPGEKPSAGRDTPSPATGPAGLRALSLALIVFLIGTLPELGRMLDFKSFETFDPSGPGLGNLFGQISPFAALGIWPSGDFRVAPGDGAAPAFLFYLGAAFAVALAIVGAARALRRREAAVLAGLVAVAAVYLAARLGGTAYTSAKALAIAAPIAVLVIARGFRGTALAAYLLAAGACSLLAFANAPVGPTSYSPALTSLRPLLGAEPTLVLAPPRLLEQEQGTRFIAWELRGGRVCIEPRGPAVSDPPPGVRYVVATGSPANPPFERLTVVRRAGPYVVWERQGVRGGPSPCPFIAERQLRSGGE